MALIIEDGTGVDDADSYITLTEARSYALARGAELSADDAVITVQITEVMDYLEAQRFRYQGVKTLPANALQWPRLGVLIDCVAIDDDVIPQELKDVEAQLIIDVSSGITLSPNVAPTSGDIKKEVVGPLTTEFFEGGSSRTQPTLTKAQDLLDVLFGACGPPAAARSLRI